MILNIHLVVLLQPPPKPIDLLLHTTRPLILRYGLVLPSPSLDDLFHLLFDFVETQHGLYLIGGGGSLTPPTNIG